MALFFNRVKVAVGAAPGTGAISLGSPVPGFRSFDAAGVPDGALVSYAMEDGIAWELGHGTYTKGGAVLNRTTIIASSAAGNAAINADANAVVFLTILAEDLAALVSGGGGGYTPKAYRILYEAINGGQTAGIGQFVFKDAAGNVINTTGGASLSSSSYGAGYEDSKPFDGTPPTSSHPGWYAGSSKAVGEYIGYTFANAVVPNTIELTPAGDSAGVSDAPQKFAFQYQDAAGNWNTQVDALVPAAAWASGVAQSFSVKQASAGSATVSALYWRLTPLSNDGFGNGVFALAELAFTVAGVVQTPIAVTSSPIQEGPIGNVIDGDPTTHLSLTPTPWFIALQYSHAITPDGISMTARNDIYCNQGPATWTIDYSQDGQNWTTLKNFTLATHWTSGGTGNAQTFPLQGAGS